MSRVIILTERNNASKYCKEKRAFYESRLQMSSSLRKNFFPPSIANNQSDFSKKSSYIKNSKEKSHHIRNSTFINSNKDIFNNMTSKKNINIKNYNSTFNNFTKEIKNYIYNNNKIYRENNKMYNSNKTFMNQSLNNSVIGKSIIHNKYIEQMEKIKKLENDELKIRKKILSLSNSLNKSSKNKDIKNQQHNDSDKIKKKFLDKNIKKKLLNLKEKNKSNIHSHTNINYSKTIITSNYPKLQMKEYKVKNNLKNNKKLFNKLSKKAINNNYNSYNNLRFRKEDNNINDINNKINSNYDKKNKLKNSNLSIIKSQDKRNKYNKYNIRININNYNNKIYRNNYNISCKRMNRTSLNSINNQNQNQKPKKEQKYNYNKNLNLNIANLINRNISEKFYKEDEEKRSKDSNSLEHIKVNKVENALCLSENSKVIQIQYDSDINQNEEDEDEEEEEDSNILSLDEVQDIIKYFSFKNVNKNDKYLFYKNDYKKFITQKKSFLINEFFEKPFHTSSLVEVKKNLKNLNKKKLGHKNSNIYHKKNGTFSSNPIINSKNNKKHKIIKK